MTDFTTNDVSQGAELDGEIIGAVSGKLIKSGTSEVFTPHVKKLPPYISASMIGMMIDCPRRWAAGHFLGQSGDQSVFDFGTRFHSVVERMNTYDVKDTIACINEVFAGFDDMEIKEVQDAVADIYNHDMIMGLKTVAQEHHFEIPIRHDLTLTGHMDHLLETEEIGVQGRVKKILIVRDYKTNRQIESAVSWTNKIQPRVYSYAVRREFPGYDEYRFEVWYTRYSRQTTWKTHDESQALVDYVCSIYDVANQMASAYSTNPVLGFPETVNRYCSYCPLKENCRSFGDMVETKPSVVQRMLTELPASRSYAYIDAMIKGLETIKDELKEKIVSAAKNDVYSDAGGEIGLSTRANVKYDADKVVEWLQTNAADSFVGMDLTNVFGLTTSGALKLKARYPVMTEVIDKNKVSSRTKPSLEILTVRDKPIEIESAR